MIEQFVPHPLFGMPGSNGQDGATTACPACGKSDLTARAPAVARSGRGRFILEDGSVASFETELARLLGEPERPRPLPANGVLLTAFLSGLVLAADLLIVAGLRRQGLLTIPEVSLDVATWLGLAWFGFFVPLFSVGRYLDSKEKAEKALGPWNESVANWRRVHYCARDDVVFLPGEGARPHRPESARILWSPADAGEPKKRSAATHKITAPERSGRP